LQKRNDKNFNTGIANVAHKDCTPGIIKLYSSSYQSIAKSMAFSYIVGWFNPPLELEPCESKGSREFIPPYVGILWDKGGVMHLSYPTNAPMISNCTIKDKRQIKIANAQKQECYSTSLQSSDRCNTLAFFLPTWD
jgi:hypothetical protein